MRKDPHPREGLAEALDRGEPASKVGIRHANAARLLYTRGLENRWLRPVPVIHRDAHLLGFYNTVGVQVKRDVLNVLRGSAT